MTIKPFELQAGLQISKQVDVASLDVGAVDLKRLCEPRQAINRYCSEDNALLQQPLKKAIKDLRGFFARAQFPCEQSRRHVPDQMFAILLSSNVQRFPIKEKDAGWHVRIRKNSTGEIAMQMLQDCDMTLRARRANPAVGASVEDVTVMKCRPSL